MECNGREMTNGVHTNRMLAARQWDMSAAVGGKDEGVDPRAG